MENAPAEWESWSYGDVDQEGDLVPLATWQEYTRSLRARCSGSAAPSSAAGRHQLESGHVLAHGCCRDAAVAGSGDGPAVAGAAAA